VDSSGNWSHIDSLKKPPLSHWLQGELPKPVKKVVTTLPIPKEFEFPEEEVILLKVLSYLHPLDLCRGLY